MMLRTFYAFAAVLVFVSCGSESSDKTESTVPTPAPVTISEVTGSPSFDSAALTLGQVSGEAKGDSVMVTFNFNVDNYTLGSQTSDAGNKLCNNSDKGQHIHFIMDNSPYAALYEPKHTVTLAKNSEHYLMAFLSRSYHESVKTPGAALVYHFTVDASGKVQKADDPKTPMVFYSRPKGDYVGAQNTENLLLDFYLWNTAIGIDSNHVLAHIKGDGVDTTLVVTDWRAYFLHNMPMGSNTITLSLTDKASNKIDGPMTEVSRNFTLTPDEPISTTGK